jgi:hypothetical protein
MGLNVPMDASGRRHTQNSYELRSGEESEQLAHWVCSLALSFRREQSQGIVPCWPNGKYDLAAPVDAQMGKS